MILALANAQETDSSTASCPTGSGNNVCLTTFQGGLNRLGLNTNEPTLTQSAITATTGTIFKKEYSVSVNGAIYAQPLVLPNVVMKGVTYTDVVYVATEEDWVYAINGANGKILWSDNLVSSGYTYLDSTTDLNGCTTILPKPGNVGVTGTPVIDISGNAIGTNNTITEGIMYLVARTKTTKAPISFVQTLYAISIIDGTVKASTVIGGTYSSGSVSLTFDGTYARTQNQRGALLALPKTGENPEIVITWSAHCDEQNFPYNGWVMAYQLNTAGTALTQSAIWTSVPSDTTYEGGIWQGSSAPAANSSGHMFFSIGNGDANVNTSVPPNDKPTSCGATPCDYGNSILNVELKGTPLAFTVRRFFHGLRLEVSQQYRL